MVEAILSVTCQLDALEENRSYLVEIAIDSEWNTIFWVEVDAYSGTALDMNWTQWRYEVNG